MAKPKAAVLGGTKKNADLDEQAFGAPFNGPLVHEAVVAELAARRRGTHSTLTLGKVSGGGRKPWRQKGTGRARQGSIRAPQWRGGGVVFGPHPRKYTQSMPKKMRRLAVRSALSAKHSDGQLRFVDAINMEAPRTKAMIEVLQNLRIGEAKTLILMSEKDENIVRSASNLGNVKTLLASYLNVVDLLKYDIVLVPHAALTQIEQWLGDGRTEAEPEAEVESV